MMEEHPEQREWIIRWLCGHGFDTSELEEVH